MSSFFDRMISHDHVASESEDDPATDSAATPAPHRDVSEDAPQTLSDVKRVTQELLRHGYLEEVQKRELFRRAIAFERDIMAALEPLDLEMRLDTHRGVAFLAIAPGAYADPEDGDAWSHPLVRRQRLTLEQSLLVAILRQAFVIHEQESGVGQSPAKIAVEELLPQFLVYFGDSGSDAKNESRLLNLLDQLKPHGIVSEVDKKQEVTIRPLIVYLANPESLESLLKALQEQARPAVDEEQAG